MYLTKSFIQSIPWFSPPRDSSDNITISTPEAPLQMKIAAFQGVVISQKLNKI